jgi:hypothetical protein
VYAIDVHLDAVEPLLMFFAVCFKLETLKRFAVERDFWSLFEYWPFLHKAKHQ